MEEVGKWEVSYTKHLKQKRKLYQQGSLLLLSNNKVVLYDDSDKLLDSKFLNKHEALALTLNAGGSDSNSMAFSSFLVDIALPQTSVDFPYKTPTTNTLSPSRKIITEFKKNQVANYTTRHTPSTLPPSSTSTTEWEALYTTQITQKAKKYHDGFIRLIICGSQARQVALYDLSRTQIDKRFLKKDEVICSGESLKFDAHLVDIGDALGSNRNDADVNKEASNSTSDQVKNSWQWQKLSKEKLVYNPLRCKEPTRQNHLKSGQSQNDTGSSKGLDLSFGVSRVDKMKPTKTPLSHMPPRDVHHILSILKKPAVQDNIFIVEKDAVMQHLSQSLEAVQSDNGSTAFESISQSDPQNVIKVTNEFKCNEAAERGNTQTTGNYPQPEITNDNIARDQASNNTALESPDKSEPSVGAGHRNKVESSANHRRSVIRQPIHLASFMGSISAGTGIEETKSTHQEPCAKLSEINAPSNEGTFGSSNKSKGKRPFSGLGGMKILKNNVNTEFPIGTLDCPSFDLGI